MGRERIKELNNFLYQIKKNFNPELVLLFGSRARNEYLKESDYDFIIVSRKFEGVHFLKRIEQILLFWDLDQDVDILPYTPKEFEKKKHEIEIVNEALENFVFGASKSMISKALKEGIVLKDRSPEKAVV